MKQAYPLKIGGKDAAGNIEILADDAAECLVATVNGDNADPEIVKYDAGQIVRTWNCHDELVEALREVRRQFEHECPPNMEMAAWQKLETALAHATAQPDARADPAAAKKP